MHLLCCLLMLWVFASDAAASEPKSILELLNRVPAPPASATEAAQWFNKEGRLVHQGLLALKADIAANKEGSHAMARAAGDAVSTGPSIQGMEDVGIDVARMQRDPTYAAEIQKKLRTMSPQDQMAFTQKMMQPQRKAQQQDMKQMAQESPPVQAAADTARLFAQKQTAWLTGPHTALGKEFLKVAERAEQKPIVVGKPKIDYDSPGCDHACDKEWTAFGAKLWPLLMARETEILQGRRAILQRYRTGLSEMVKEGQAHLTASRYGAAATSLMNRTAIAGYHEGLLGDISGLIDLTETAAKRAAGIVNSGVEKWYLR